MAKHFIIVLLICQLLHHAFACPDDTDAMRKELTVAIRRVKLDYQNARLKDKADNWPNKNILPQDRKIIRIVLTTFRALQGTSWNVVETIVPLMIEHMMKPVVVSLTEADFQCPFEEMTQTNLEFRWEILDLVYYVLTDLIAVEPIEITKSQVRPRWIQDLSELRRRMHEKHFGATPVINYSPDTPLKEIDWPSNNMIMVAEIARGSKALESFKSSNETPVSSLTEAEILLRWSDHPVPRLVNDLYSKGQNCRAWAYERHFHILVAQRKEFITVACTRFLERFRESCDLRDTGLLEEMREEIDGYASTANDIMRGFYFEMRDCYDSLLTKSRSLVFQPREHVFSTIINLKAEMAAKEHQVEDAIAQIQNPDPFGVFTESPSMAFAAEYHLLLLWRCIQKLSLLLWFKNGYGSDVQQENFGVTTENVNAALTEIVAVAEYILEIFDAYVNFVRGQSLCYELSAEERQEVLGLIRQANYHVASAITDAQRDSHNVGTSVRPSGRSSIGSDWDTQSSAVSEGSHGRRGKTKPFYARLG
ncbi:hypothetical protein SeLEV6574_g06070 [Synchytrium endobioticum]|uniref:Uncharacterized protein n=1 Tax=Synchytrium endobioticum TaxID=286115 RepID=A0A507CQR9_9FUNG|nr:hypothetical protein SeLEV6574_g06070 [Synchytrium endobioticum]